MVFIYGKKYNPDTQNYVFIYSYIFHRSCHVNLVKRSKPDNFDLIINYVFPKDL